MASTTTVSDLPGPRIYQLIGLLREFRADRLKFLTDCARRYGDRVALRLGLRPAILLSDPDDIEVVLVNSRDFIKPWYLRNATVLGRGLIPSYGDFWKRQRRLMQPAFHRSRITTYAETMVAYAQRIASTWNDGETRDVHADMMRVSKDVVIKTLFNLEPGGEGEHLAEVLDTMFQTVDDRVNSLIPLPESWPTPGNIRFRRAVHEIDEIVYGFIRQRRAAGPAGQGDLLSILVQARDESDGTGMTDQQLRDETVTLFLAGLDTSATTLSWIWYLLSEHPSAEERLMEELRSVLAGRAPTVEDLPRLEFTRMVIDEALRLYPPGFVMGREAAHDCVVNGLEVRAGTTLLMSQWVVHRDPRFFADPDEFKPERWADGLGKRLPKYAYFPFGGGPHQCIGENFALMELALVLPTLAQQFKLTLAPGHSVTPQALFLLRPKDGVHMTIQRR